MGGLGSGGERDHDPEDERADHGVPRDEDEALAKFYNFRETVYCLDLASGESSWVVAQQVFEDAGYGRRRTPQISVCSEISRASSTSMPRYRTVDSSLECPSSS